LVTAAFVVVLNLTLFILIAEDLLEGGGLTSHDNAVLRWFVEHRTGWLISGAKLVGLIASFVSLSIVAALFGLWLWRRCRRLEFAIAPLLSLVLAALASTVAKSLFDRARPPVAVRATTVTLASFPSGHSTNAAAFFLSTSFVVALVFARRRREQLLAIVAGSLLVAVVGVSRLVLGVHWASDVVAGWALGAAFAITVVVVLWYVSASGMAASFTAPADSKG
jgi:membrane-associated phospholipid phosphatase